VRVTRIVRNTPDAQTVTQAELIVKPTRDDLDSAAVMTLLVTPTASAAGQVTNTGSGLGSARRAQFHFTLTSVQTALLVADADYYFRVRVWTSGNERGTVESGFMTADAG